MSPPTFLVRNKKIAYIMFPDDSRRSRTGRYRTAEVYVVSLLNNYTEYPRGLVYFLLQCCFAFFLFFLLKSCFPTMFLYLYLIVFVYLSQKPKALSLSSVSQSITHTHTNTLYLSLYFTLNFYGSTCSQVKAKS